MSWAALGDDVVATFVRRRAEPLVMTRGELVSMVWREAAGMAGAGARPGERVVIALPTSPEYFASFWACQLLGLVPVPAHPPLPGEGRRGADRLRTMLRVAAPFGVRCVPEVAAELQAGGETCVLGPAPQVRTALELPSSIGAGDCALLQFTSGSTSSPRGCALSHAAILHNMGSMTVATRYRPGDTGVSWCPLHHDMGLITTVVWPIVSDIRGVILDPAHFLATPMVWLRAMAAHRAALSMAPNFAFDLVVKKLAGRAPDLDLTCVRTIINGGEPIAAETVEAFVDALAPCGLDPAVITPAWGMAETTLVATAAPDGTRVDVVDRDRLGRGEAREAAAAAPAARVVSVGRPVGGAQVRVVDRDRQPLGERSIGAVELKSDSLMTGYVGSDGPSPIRDGWLMTGDVGYLADGELHLVGRSKELIILGGRNIAPVDVERAVEKVAGVRTGGVVAFGVPRDGTEQLVVVAEARMVDQGSAAEARTRCLEALGVLPRDVVFVRSRSLPKTSSGKPQRLEVRRRYLTDALDRQDVRVGTPGA
jgi:acyl-CoA synthetase (AMP-forming)/AMP-acid ligase II